MKFSFVIPHRNMGRWLAQAIDSLLAQNDPDLEIIVRDGLSTDGSDAVARQYEGRITWISEQDAGASDALRKGLAQARGDILAWLNADDLLLPGALKSARRALEQHPQASAVYGAADWIDEEGARLGPYPVQPFSLAALSSECIICQPACFFRRDAYHRAGGLDPRWDCSFDYDLWIRLARLSPLVHVPEKWACSRMHRANKSLRQRTAVLDEGIALLREHFHYVPPHWINSRICFRRDRRDQFFEPIQSSRSSYLQTLAEGLWLNRRHPLRFTAQWWRERHGRR